MGKKYLEGCQGFIVQLFKPIVLGRVMDHISTVVQHIWFTECVRHVNLIAAAFTVRIFTIHRLARDHPPIGEKHINLSGRARWLVRGNHNVRMAAAPASVIHIERERNRKNIGDPMAEYDGQNLAAGVTTIAVFSDERQCTAPAILPLLVVPGPDLASIAGPDGLVGAAAGLYLRPLPGPG